jgi:hypothetical protein
MFKLLELQVIQKEKEQLLKQMIQMGDQIEMYEKQIEILKKGSSFITCNRVQQIQQMDYQEHWQT